MRREGRKGEKDERKGERREERKEEKAELEEGKERTSCWRERREERKGEKAELEEGQERGSGYEVTFIGRHTMAQKAGVASLRSFLRQLYVSSPRFN